MNELEEGREREKLKETILQSWLAGDGEAHSSSTYYYSVCTTMGGGVVFFVRPSERSYQFTTERPTTTGEDQPREEEEEEGLEEGAGNSPGIIWKTGVYKSDALESVVKIFR